MDKKDIYTRVLHEELIPAMGCTEPIAIAYAAAKAKSYLPEDVERYEVDCSGNIIKNVKGVKVPNSNGQKGIPAAAALGICGGDPSKVLEVIAGVTDAQREACRELVARDVCNVGLVEGVPGLYIDVKLWGKVHSSEVILSGNHTNICKIIQDGNILYDQSQEIEKGYSQSAERNQMSLKGILEYAAEVDLKKVEDVLEAQIRDNTAISREGLTHPWGTQVGKIISENIGDSVMTRAEAAAAAGSDARMSGCPKPVVINAGSGNQGITVTMPILVYAEEWGLSHDETLRALIVGDLISVYIKHFIGPLSAFCGSVNAACGAGAAITWIAGRDYQHVADTITNTLCNVGGIVCDGAKPSCAAKIAAAVHGALVGHYMSMRGQVFKAGEGLVGKDIESTIRNIGYLGREGMKQTDIEILNTMLGNADTSADLL